MRTSAHLCPVPGCGNLRLSWEAVCRSCWKKLPADLRAAISEAKRERARHREAAAAIAATRWLTEHRPGGQVEKILGERDDGLAPP